MQPESASSTTLDHYKQRIKELDAEVVRGRENYDQANEAVRTFKKTLSERNTYIDQLHNKIALLNTVNLADCLDKIFKDPNLSLPFRSETAIRRCLTSRTRKTAQPTWAGR